MHIHRAMRIVMRSQQKFKTLALAIATATLCSCAANSDRYPSLSLREFERVEGTFTAATPSSESIRPTPAPIEQVEQVAQALADAIANHDAFMDETKSAYTAVAAAEGQSLGSDDWSIALVTLAGLDSRRNATAITLADLDDLYASATLSFTERDEVGEARKQIVEMIVAEDRILNELSRNLEPVPAPE